MGRRSTTKCAVLAPVKPGQGTTPTPHRASPCWAGATMKSARPIHEDAGEYVEVSLWSAGLPHVASMAQDGNGVISRQPRSHRQPSVQSQHHHLQQQQQQQQQLRGLELPALQSAPSERQARQNDYVSVPGIDTLYRNKRNNNDSSAELGFSGGHHHRGHRSTTIVVSDNGKTKVLKLAKREGGRTRGDGQPGEREPAGPGRTPVHCYNSKVPLTCPTCGGCYCDSCRSRTELPQTWLCGERYQCSAESALDYATCLCCVRGLFYHLADSNHDDYSWGDNPCSCGDHKCCLRWSLMGVISLVLPCLWCYLPGRGCLAACKFCFARDACKCKDPDYETL